MGASRGDSVSWTIQTSGSSEERSPVEICVRVTRTKNNGHEEEKAEEGDSEGHSRTVQPSGSQ